MPVLSDLRYAYHTDGEASLPALSMKYGVKRRPMRVKPSGGLLAARRRRKDRPCPPPHLLPPPRKGPPQI